MIDKAAHCPCKPPTTPRLAADDELAATKTMIKRTEETQGLKPKRLVADTGYGTGKFLGWLVGTGITPHIPVKDMSDRDDGTFSSSDFTFDRERNVYVCPTNKLLKTTGNVGSDHKVRYRASRRDCGKCPLKSQCSPNTPSRKITRDVHEDARDHARSFVGTPEFDRSRNERKKVEMRFAHLEDPPSFRAHAATGALRRARRVSPRRHRAKSQDLGAANL